MDEYIIPNVPYVAQTDPRWCWNAGYRMMLLAAGRPDFLVDCFPNDADMKDRGILDSEFQACRDALGLTSSSWNSFNSLDKLQQKLEMYGPIWCSGFWCDGHKHIVIARGVGDQGVYVNDPYRGMTGAAARPSWWSWGKFVNNMNRVPFAFQHWYTKPPACADSD